MALERLQALATACIPDLDRAVVRRRREPCRVVREGDRVDRTAMALERLQAGTPFISHSRLYRDPLRLFLLEKTPCQAAGWAEQECRRICLKRIVLDDASIRQNKSMSILNQTEKLGLG